MNLHIKFALKNQRTNTLLYRVDQKNMVYMEINSVQRFSSIFFWKNWTSDKNPDSTETSRVSWETRNIKNTPGKTYRLFMSLEIEPLTRFYNT
jgi:hypothetical protein